MPPAQERGEYYAVAEAGDGQDLGRRCDEANLRVSCEKDEDVPRFAYSGLQRD